MRHSPALTEELTRRGTMRKSWRPRWMLPVLGSAAAGLLLTGVAFAYWTSSGSGSGQATAGSASTVTLSAGTVTSTLFPGGTADVGTLVTNPNPYAVLISGLSAGTITSGTAGNACDTNGNHVTFNVPGTYPSTTYRVPAKAGVVGTGNPAAFAIDIANGASMAINSDTTCQAKTFTIPLSGTATATS
jgi:hypothetical protein